MEHVINVSKSDTNDLSSVIVIAIESRVQLALFASKAKLGLGQL